MSKMQYTEKFWGAIGPIYQKIIDHPFNQQLMEGTLDMERFRFYINQDSLYLADFGRALATLAGKSGDTEDALAFIKFAENSIVVERALHKGYFEKFKIGPSYEKSPGCFSYTNYLLATCHFKSYEEAVAALLPCFWIYREVGNHIYQHSKPGNLYQEWIDTYAGEEFNKSVEMAIGITERLAGQASAKQREGMLGAFVNSSKLEYIFWDSAYRKETWPV